MRKISAHRAAGRSVVILFAEQQPLVQADNYIIGGEGDDPAYRQSDLNLSERGGYAHVWGAMRRKCAVEPATGVGS